MMPNPKSDTEARKHGGHTEKPLCKNQPRFAVSFPKMHSPCGLRVSVPPCQILGFDSGDVGLLS